MKTVKKIFSVFSIAVLGGISAVGVDHFYILKQNNWNARFEYRNPLPVKFAGLTTPVAENTINFVSAAQKAVPAWCI